MLTVADVADRLGVSVSLIYELVAKEQIACYRVGTGRGAIRFEEADVEAYIQSRKHSVPGPAAATRRKRQPATDWF